jgi:hypothetical protein
MIANSHMRGRYARGEMWYIQSRWVGCTCGTDSPGEVELKAGVTYLPTYSSNSIGGLAIGRPVAG